MLNGHGDDIYAHEKKIVSNFSSNVYSHTDYSALHEYLCNNISTIHSYPEPDAITLRNAISEKKDISNDRIIITNGATEAIYLIAQAFRGSKTGVVVPTFSEYEDASRVHDHQLYFLKDLEDIQFGTSLIWICNPNNPTGNVYNKEYLISIVLSHPNICFVIDQSYEGFTSQPVLSPREAATFDNVILLHSLTKCYAIPGLRLGYITSQPKLIERIRYYSMPWSVNQVAQLAGLYLLEYFKYDFSDYISQSLSVQKNIDQIKGVSVEPSVMHYFLCKLNNQNASDLKLFLINEYGILIRDAANFRGLDRTYFRIAIQSPKENDRLIDAIKGWTKLHY